MKNKCISLSTQNIALGKVVWNHPLFLINKVIGSLYFESMRANIPQVFCEQLHECIRLQGIDSWDVPSIIKDITDFFPALTQSEAPINPSAYDFQIWSYLNHFAIIKLDILIQQVSKSTINVEDEVVPLLRRLVDQSNISSAECFQISVHFACKFFAEFYPARREEINKIILLEDHQRELRGED